MTRLLICLILIVLSDARAEDDSGPIDFGGGMALELVHSTDGHSWLVNLDAGVWSETDLGELFGMEDWYLFFNPILSWGGAEGWKWTPRWYQAWLKWDGIDEFNALFGLVDLTWHFHSLPSSSLFVPMPGHTLGEFLPGNLGLMDLYPFSAPTVRFEWKPVSHLYFQTAASWLNKDHQVKGRELFLKHETTNHLIGIAELGWNDPGIEDSGSRHRIAGVGGWWLPGASSWGGYVFTDIKLWAEVENSHQGLSGFVSGSAAKSAGHTIEHRIALGLSYEGLIPGRDNDSMAVALIQQDDADYADRSDRMACEYLYRVRAGKHFWIQASVQWQSNIEGSGKDEWRAGLRVGLDF